MTDSLQFEQLIERTMLSLHGKGGSSFAHGTATPVTSLIDSFFNDAIRLNASDIHIEPLATCARIRLRIDGVLSPLYSPFPLKLHSHLLTRLKIMSNLDSIEYRLPQDGRFSYQLGTRLLDVRVSTLPLLNGEKIVLRLLNVSNKLLSISELGFTSANKTTFESWYKKPHGLILNVGPVNSGKTTTLYAALNELNQPIRNIVSLEDPIEYHLEGINQIQVSQKSELTFSRGLRAVLRQDPDIVMLGEIRDEETAEMAIRAALTGHLLLTTLHTNDASSAIYRLIDMKIPPYLISASLLGIIAQRLVRRLCPKCAIPYTVKPNSSEAALLGNYYSPSMILYKGTGCLDCNFTGYKGRIAIHELLSISSTVRQAILDKISLHDFENLAKKNGLQTLLEDGIQKALAKKTTLSEIQRVLYGDF